MNKIILLLIIAITFLCSCEDMYEKQRQFEGEIVYPARYDTVVGHIGFERVEIDLLKAGRIPSSQITLGKAKKTIIEYDDQVITIDSLVSYVNITGLTQPKLYRFRIYTVDQHGNKSVPQEIALIPFTSTDLATFAVSPPRILASPSSAVIDWPGGISSVLFDYYGLEFSYKNRYGEIQSGKREMDTRFFIGGLEAGKPVELSMTYKIIPKINRQPILDTVYFESKLTVNMPTGSTPFTPAERDILMANGVTEFTSDGVAGIDRLTYPVHANSLQDIFFFPSLKTLDLTGGDMFLLPELHYNNNDIQDIAGGGHYAPFMRRSGDIAHANQQALKDMLEAGILEKVYYIPNSMGLDALLNPYVDAGVVELVKGPDEVLIDHQFNIDGRLQAWHFEMDITFPATDAPTGDGIVNPYKLTLKTVNSTFVIALPKEYEFNPHEYRYIKFKAYAPDASNFQGIYDRYRCLWPRFMNRLWAFPNNSISSQLLYWHVTETCIPFENLEQWVDVTVDISNAIGRHTRVLLLNFGREPGVAYGDNEIIYYISNLRFSKNP